MSTKTAKRYAPTRHGTRKPHAPIATITGNDSEGQAAAAVAAEVAKIARHKSCDSLVMMDGNGAVWVIPAESDEAARRETREPQNVVGLWRRVTADAMTLVLWRFRQRRTEGKQSD